MILVLLLLVGNPLAVDLPPISFLHHDLLDPTHAHNISLINNFKKHPIISSDHPSNFYKNG